MRDKKQTVLNLLFLLLLLGLTMFLMLRGQDLSFIIEQAAKVKKIYLLLGILLVVIFVCCESLIIKYLLHVVNIKWPLYRCIRYSFIGFFFSCITPSATGGQPAQVYYMKKEGLDISTSTIILLLVTIEYKFVLVFIGLGVLFFGHNLLAMMTEEVLLYIILGLVLNILCIIFMCFLVFLPNLSRTIMRGVYKILWKIHIIKNMDAQMEKLEKSMDNYQRASVFLKENKFAIFNVFLISLVQRLLHFYITYMVYLSFGLSEYSAVTVTILQAVISIAVDMLPLPGGMGISEHLFKCIFTPVFAGSVSLTLSAMLLSRGISYYALIIISAVITMYSHVAIRRQSKIKKGVEKK